MLPEFITSQRKSMGRGSGRAMDEPDSGERGFRGIHVTAQGLTAPSAERCSPFTWGLKCVPITRKPVGNLCTQHTLLFATAEAQQNAKRRQAQGVSEGIKCEMDSPPKSLLEEVQHRLSAAGTPGSRRGEGGGVSRRWRRWEASRTNGWRRRFISSPTSAAWLPTLVSDVSDRGGAAEMRWVEAPQPERRHLLPLARPAEVSPAALQLSGKRDLP